MSLETRQKESDYSASLAIIADFVHHMFIYTKREKEGQCVSVDLLGDLLFSVLTWILQTRVYSTCLIFFMLTAHSSPHSSAS